MTFIDLDFSNDSSSDLSVEMDDSSSVKSSEYCWLVCDTLVTECDTVSVTIFVIESVTEGNEIWRDVLRLWLVIDLGVGVGGGGVEIPILDCSIMSTLSTVCCVSVFVTWFEELDFFIAEVGRVWVIADFDRLVSRDRKLTSNDLEVRSWLLETRPKDWTEIDWSIRGLCKSAKSLKTGFEGIRNT